MKRLFLSVAVIALSVFGRPAFAWIHDRDSNRIDDRIERTHAVGLAAAYENDDISQRARIAFFSDGQDDVDYGVYIGFTRRPTDDDLSRLTSAGLSDLKSYLYIDYVRARGTFEQVAAASLLPGVSRVEAIPMMYPFNHFGSRVLRARDSQGVGKSQDYALFPSARTDLGLDGTGIVIAVLDTGVNDETDNVNSSYPGHESLRGKFLGGGSFYFGQPLLNTALDASENPNDHGAEASSYHATHVAGSAMGTGGENGFFAGVAPAARLVDCKVLSDAGAGFGSADGIEWCIYNKDNDWGLTGDEAIYAGIDVLSLSLGGTDASDGTDANSQMVNAAVAAGLVVCIATGNDSAIDHIASPAAADHSIAVGATTHYNTLVRTDDTVTSFSNEGPRTADADSDQVDEMKPSLVGPGDAILSADGDYVSSGESYKRLSGTSMSTPHISGVCALLLQANPNLTPLGLRSILQNTAEHFIPTVKAARPNDPFAIDSNYNPACGWGLADAYAAAKEAMNSTGGVQVVQIRPVARPLDGAVDVHWITQREYANLGFKIYRAEDVAGTPGPFELVSGPTPIAPTGDSVLEGDDNRTLYTFIDNDELVLGSSYWYQVRWLDPSATEHTEPHARVDFGDPPYVGILNYSIVHNAFDHDVTATLGYSVAHDPGAADWTTFGDGTSGADSIAVLEPANAATATIGYLEHFWSLGLRQGLGLEPALPPSASNPWFLNVAEGGYVNRSGRITSFSMFIPYDPGGTSGYTVVTQDPLPIFTVEMSEVTAWLDMNSSSSSGAARLRAETATDGVRIIFEAPDTYEIETVRISRSLGRDPMERAPLHEQPERSAAGHLEVVDTDVTPDQMYYYWAEFVIGGRTVLAGPVLGRQEGVRTSFALESANPLGPRTVLSYFLGPDAAAGGMAHVRIAVVDIAGRVVRDLIDQNENSGAHVVDWDGRDGEGRELSRGIYFVRFQAGSVATATKVTVIH